MLPHCFVCLYYQKNRDGFKILLSLEGRGSPSKTSSFYEKDSTHLSCVSWFWTCSATMAPIRLAPAFPTFAIATSSSWLFLPADMDPKMEALTFNLLPHSLENKLNENWLLSTGENVLNSLKTSDYNKGRNSDYLVPIPPPKFGPTRFICRLSYLAL